MKKSIFVDRDLAKSIMSCNRHPLATDRERPQMNVPFAGSLCFLLSISTESNMNQAHVSDFGALSLHDRPWASKYPSRSCSDQPMRSRLLPAHPAERRAFGWMN